MRYIIISGIDGSGKTSIIQGVVEELHRRNLTTDITWLRYNHYFVKPLHLIARLIGLSKQYESSEGNVWRHEFFNSKLFSWLYIRFTYFDTLIGKMILMYKVKNNPNFMICDRWLNDVLIDLGTKTHNDDFLNSKWYCQFKKMLPKNSTEFLIIRNKKDLLSCRKENQEDPDFSFRLKLYNVLAEKEEIIIINNSNTIEMAISEIIKNLCGK